MRQLIVVVFLIVYGVCANAQTESKLIHAWYMYFGNHKLTDKISLHTEYQFRRHGVIKDWQQSLARIGIDYKINPNNMVTAGYGFITSYPYGNLQLSKSNEHRIWEQFISNQRVGIAYLQHRYRLEQRFIEDVFRQRARYRLLVTFPLSNKELIDNTLFLSLYDEIFINFGETARNNIFDQNRIFIALGWRFNKNVNVQAGYLLQQIFRGNSSFDESNNTLQLALTYNMDWSRSSND